MSFSFKIICVGIVLNLFPEISSSTGKDDVIRTGSEPAQHNDCIRLINTAASSACAGVDTASCNWLKEMSSGSFSLDKDAFLILVSSAKTGSFTERLTHIGGRMARRKSDTPQKAAMHHTSDSEYNQICTLQRSEKAYGRPETCLCSTR